MKYFAATVIFFTALTSLTSSCSAPLCRQAELINHITRQHAALEKKKHNLELVGFGSAGPTKTTQFCLTYASFEKVDIKEARRLLFDISEDALNIINANEEMRPYLSDYPYTFKNLDIGIVFFETFGTYVNPPYVGLASIVPERNLISYAFYKPDPIGFFNDLKHKETVEEARRILCEERTSN
jgi:hypothetical protein